MSYRYLGNKTRLKNWIGSIMSERLSAGAFVADPMCGTATVSAELADRGFNVIASDQLKFPVLHAQARLLYHDSLSFFPAATSYAKCLQILNELQPVKGFFFREYSDEGAPTNGSAARKYLTGQNAAHVDAIRARIRAWRQEGLHSLAADLLLHDLILAVNRIANIAGTYGYYRSIWSNSSRAALWLTQTASKNVTGRHRVMHGPADEIAGRISVDAFYLDPPYTKRQYAGNYHLPETLACEDEPVPAGDGGLRDWSKQASDFCYRRRTEAAFKKILDKIDARWVFISYSEDAHLPSSQLTNLLLRYGRVELHEQPLERFRSNAKVARKGDVREHLYILEMSNVGAAKSSRSLDAQDNPQHTLQY